ncbi:NUDIX hydrolase [Beduini massiliensis]|uniref:NUDIX hydrolase n=1 Tax=Beduini massiliensis TaxID=1585974 RepID=UPI00059A80EE|nr:NUDIX hydrolase [Beduini massiliensis]
MQGYNVIVVYNETADRLLMCTRRKNPYKGLSNLVGGKIEDDEDGISAAYRELYEETSISQNDIILTHLMDFTYYLDDCYVEVYVGKLNKFITVIGDENDLYWSATDCNFFDVSKFAGEGNIGHIIEHVNLFKNKLLI